ncbi:MAG: alpha/beta hydrolase [Saprospiraceae bacterium]|nr:alpha/beta hydrolase [Saprospiraceae bacterium]
MKPTMNLTFLALLIIFAGCQKNTDQIEPDVKSIKKVYTTLVDGISREYIVSVPKSYNGQSKVPVVFMLHGTSGDGEKFYNISGWKELGEQENILTVYPSSLSKCITEGTETKTISKWNAQPLLDWNYCQGVNPPDDVKFLEKVLNEIQLNYTIETKQVYFVGFSNGGQMCALLSIFMGDRIAAIVESAGSFNIDSTFIPKRNLPITFQIGNKDYGPGVEGPEIPLSDFETALNNQSYYLNRVKETHINSFHLNPNYSISGDTSTAMTATFLPLSGSENNSFNFVYIKGLGHEYPNGKNHWLNGARANWDWLKNFKLP